MNENTMDYTKVLWRVGRKVGRTVYVQLGEKPTDNDPLIGLFDTPQLAKDAVQSHNLTITQNLDKQFADF